MSSRKPNKRQPAPEPKPYPDAPFYLPPEFDPSGMFRQMLDTIRTEIGDAWPELCRVGLETHLDAIAKYAVPVPHEVEIHDLFRSLLDIMLGDMPLTSTADLHRAVATCCAAIEHHSAFTGRIVPKTANILADLARSWQELPQANKDAWQRAADERNQPPPPPTQN